MTAPDDAVLTAEEAVQDLVGPHLFGRKWIRTISRAERIAAEVAPGYRKRGRFVILEDLDELTNPVLLAEHHAAAAKVERARRQFESCLLWLEERKLIIDPFGRDLVSISALNAALGRPASPKPLSEQALRKFIGRPEIAALTRDQQREAAKKEFHEKGIPENVFRAVFKQEPRTAGRRPSYEAKS